MSAYAKSVVGALAAVLVVAIQTWQQASAGGFHLVAIIPISTAIAGAVLTYLVPNVPQLPWAKAAVSAVLGVLTALSTYLQGAPGTVSVSTLVVVALGALATWYVPNIAPVPPTSAATGHHEAA